MRSFNFIIMHGKEPGEAIRSDLMGCDATVKSWIKESKTSTEIRMDSVGLAMPAIENLSLVGCCCCCFSNSFRLRLILLSI